MVNGNACMCDNQINPLVPQAAGSCTTACATNAQENCGGSNAINVYQINRQDSTSQSNITNLPNLIANGDFSNACTSGLTSCSTLGSTFGSWAGFNQAGTGSSDIKFSNFSAEVDNWGLLLDSNYRVRQSVNIIAGNWYLFLLDLNSAEADPKNGTVTLTHGSAVETVLLYHTGGSSIVAGKKFKATGTYC